jgi:predicted dehydrogenase
MDRTKVGVIGCGNISGTYLEVSRMFEDIEVAACSDAIMGRAKEKAEKFNVPKACTVEELLSNPEVEIILNLTPPNAHAEIAIKSIYSELIQDRTICRNL